MTELINKPGTLAIVVGANIYKENIGRLVNVHHIAKSGEQMPDGYTVGDSVSASTWVISAYSGTLRTALSSGSFIDKEYALVNDAHIRPLTGIQLDDHVEIESDELI